MGCDAYGVGRLTDSGLTTLLVEFREPYGIILYGSWNYIGA